MEVLFDREGVIIYKPTQHGFFRRRRIADNQVPKGVQARMLPVNKYNVKLVQTRHFQHLPSKVSDETPLEFKDFLNGGKESGCGKASFSMRS